MTIWEILRILILGIGWPVLIISSLLIIKKIKSAHGNIEKAPYGKLVLTMLSGLVITMFSLGLIATSYITTNLIEGVKVTLPIFLIWLATISIIFKKVFILDKQATKTESLYQQLEELLKDKALQLVELKNQKTELDRINTELSRKNNELSSLNKIMVGRELDMIKIKEEMKTLKSSSNQVK